MPKGKVEQDGLPKSPSMQSLRGRASFERFTAPFGSSTTDVPPVPHPQPGSLHPPPSTEPPRKKDELWGVFRNLDADYQKYVYVFEHIYV